MVSSQTGSKFTTGRHPCQSDGWCLTDNAANLSKWSFPGVTLLPGDFLVVFASGKDRRIPGSELHTNFQLSSGGEYLALVEPDGTTVAHQYAPSSPTQDPDRTYGLAFDGTPLVAEGATAQILVPSDGTLGTTWTQSGFNPSGWVSGDTGVGFGLQIPGLTVRDVHSNGTLSSLSSADAALAGSNVASETIKVELVCNFLDSGSDGHFGNNLVFPGGGGDDYVVEVTGTIIIPTAGVWTFGLNSDDGGRIRIDGVKRDGRLDPARSGGPLRLAQPQRRSSHHRGDVLGARRWRGNGTLRREGIVHHV